MTSDFAVCSLFRFAVVFLPSSPEASAIHCEARRKLSEGYVAQRHRDFTLTWLERVENKLGSKKKAEQHLTQAFSQKMVAPISYLNRAAVRLENGNAKAALADADTAVKQDRWLKEGYEVRSAIREKLGDGAGAAKDAEEAKKLISHFDL